MKEPRTVRRLERVKGIEPLVVLGFLQQMTPDTTARERWPGFITKYPFGSPAADLR